MKKTVESNWNQISDDEWEVEDVDSFILDYSSAAINNAYKHFHNTDIIVYINN